MRRNFWDETRNLGGAIRLSIEDAAMWGKMRDGRVIRGEVVSRIGQKRAKKRGERGGK